MPKQFFSSSLISAYGSVPHEKSWPTQTWVLSQSPPTAVQKHAPHTRWSSTSVYHSSDEPNPSHVLAPCAIAHWSSADAARATHASPVAHPAAAAGAMQNFLLS